MNVFKAKDSASSSPRWAAFSSVALLCTTGSVWAQNFGGTDGKVCGFLTNVNGLLNLGSIAVVTIAVIFAGYQIAFAHKRIADVAPILIGGMLIGAAGQIAKMLIGEDGESCDAAAPTTQIVQAIIQYYA